MKVALLGYGEAGMAFAEGWPKTGHQIKAFDVKINNAGTCDELISRCAETGVICCENLEDAVGDAEAVFSFVTADQAHKAAQDAAPHCADAALFFDCNSCAPGTKRKSALLLDKAGCRYIDAAVMAPVHPNLHRTKIHICGDHTDAALQVADTLDMNITVMAGDVGTASSTKMIRSIMMKGLEAVMMECVLAGKRAGVDDLVFESLDKTYPGFNFKQKAAYMMERVMVHGERRAAEMREVALTVEELGLSNEMSGATVEWQERIGSLKLDPDYALGEEDYQPRADLILKALENK